jgi:hypothetical protein
MKLSLRLFPAIIAGFGLNLLNAATPPDPVEAEYYKIETFNLPDDCAAEVGSIELLPGNKVAFGTRRGEIWTVENAIGNDISKAHFTKYAEGLHEILGLAWKDGWLYVTQRPEVSRLKDGDGDGRADVFETVNADWNILGDYHEYAFGSRPDKQGNIWVALCLTGSFHSNAPWRGWAVRITPDGKMLPTTAGLRSPGGIGMIPDGEMFFDDNQGVWNGSSSLKHLSVGGFVGHPDTLKWWELTKGTLGERPLDSMDHTRIEDERKRNPKYEPPAVQLPHGHVGNSPTAWDWDEGGKFGPFIKQLMIADQSWSVLNRVFLEKINGVYQGACFPFLKGLKSGPIGVRMSSDGSTLFVGGSDRGWGAKGGSPHAFERVTWTGKVPFEIHEMHAKSDGFELTFTEPVDVDSAKNAESYKMREYTWEWREQYGGPEVDEVIPKIEVVSVGTDAKSVHLKITPLTKGHVHQLDLPGLKSKDGKPLLHPAAYYTLNEIPKP